MIVALIIFSVNILQTVINFRMLSIIEDRGRVTVFHKFASFKCVSGLCAQNAFRSGRGSIPDFPGELTALP